jgi:hypothetical protein
MKDVLGHGSNPRDNADAARRLGDGHPKSAPVAVHPDFDSALRMVRNADDAELVNISHGQRQALLSATLRQKAQQLGEAFK